MYNYSVNRYTATGFKRVYFKSKLTARCYALVLRYVFRQRVYTSKLTKYNIDTDLGIEYLDAGPWRGYQLTASGNDRAELKSDATIEEIDQDGGTLRSYRLDDADLAVYDAALRSIDAVLRRVN